MASYAKAWRESMVLGGPLDSTASPHWERSGDGSDTMAGNIGRALDHSEGEQCDAGGLGPVESSSMYRAVRTTTLEGHNPGPLPTD